jgi:hypothetical protein
MATPYQVAEFVLHCHSRPAAGVYRTVPKP